MIKAVIIDDEKLNISNLSGLLAKHCPQVTVTGTALNVDTGVTLIDSVKPDLVFLDIMMPGKTGFDLLRSIPSPEFEVIFVTAFDQYGIQAIKFSAVDYLLKPLIIEDLIAAVNKVEKKLSSKVGNLQLQNLLSMLHGNQQKSEHRIALTTSGETRFVSTEDIIRCESSNSYTTFFINNSNKIVVSRPIFEYEELLADYGFKRCHQSHLVNRRYIKSLLKTDGYVLLMQDGSKIPVSRLKKDLITGWLGV
ncbi:MAG: response regulator transcription factor [Chitinophagaceae bacterium]|nr:MAG: response regulator transcription factor [Chitinophagaceae bacterium]